MSTTCGPHFLPNPHSRPDRELEVQRELRQERVFAIGSAAAKDLSNALSTNDIGAHVADVLHFVKLGKDRVAHERSKGHPEWFVLVVIRSSAQLPHAGAQEVIDGRLLEGVSISPEHGASTSGHDIKILNRITWVFRERRLKSGASTLIRPTRPSPWTSVAEVSAAVSLIPMVQEIRDVDFFCVGLGQPVLVPARAPPAFGSPRIPPPFRIQVPASSRGHNLNTLSTNFVVA